MDCSHEGNRVSLQGIVIGAPDESCLVDFLARLNNGLSGLQDIHKGWIQACVTGFVEGQ
jgi:hypothetical protein